MAGRLILVPTPQELSHLRDGLDSLAVQGDVVDLCGFGLALAGARTSQLIANHQPLEVILLGIAGGYDGTPLASAIEFDVVGCHGIGVGVDSPDQYESAGTMGWPQYKDDVMSIGDQLDLVAQPSVNRRLLSVSAGSATRQQAELRCRTSPGWNAEDMEGFSVAAACKLAGVTCRIIRGISNDAGNRDHASWKTSEALQAVIEYLRDHPTRNQS